jgi:hypothetical protein
VNSLCGRIVESQPDAVAAAIVELIGEERELQRERCVEQAKRFEIKGSIEHFVNLYIEMTHGQAEFAIA